jgi:hypothetical protein
MIMRKKIQVFPALILLCVKNPIANLLNLRGRLLAITAHNGLNAVGEVTWLEGEEQKHATR